ncbi:hypothetical protein Sros_8860 [Streptosporangium roseum DSM 43021]|uniref:Uncharacterized protein n=1 Tax=Streptosporangium roseum (strain ATCC 12428 / DSM 43021 / JCM 3005 / KCTC 9067 / NCIMB 10171 / NRRL 2505 / NI 9100) TaxID=479432 RepID=D2B7H2_STRRD|nr:hypothetical protein Sros_8860 [Streptosporangium roseum DSM 43021]
MRADRLACDHLAAIGLSATLIRIRTESIDPA